MSELSTQGLKGYVSKRKRKVSEVKEPSSSADQCSSSPSLLSPYMLSVCDTGVKKPKFKSTVPKSSTRLPSKPVLSLELHPVDDCLLISAGLDGQVVLWDVK